MQVPHIFSPGYAAKSAEVNENFAALAAAVTQLEAQVAALGAGNPPIPGNYFLMGFQTGLGAFGQEAVIEGIVYTGPVVLSGAVGATSGAATLTLREAKNELHIGGPLVHREFKDITETIEASWSLDPVTGLRLHVPDNPLPLRFARAAPRLFIGNHLRASDGSSVMLFLVRNQA